LTYGPTYGGAGAGGTILLKLKNLPEFNLGGNSANAGASLQASPIRGANGSTSGKMDQSIQARGGDAPETDINVTSGGGGVVSIVKS
jgi:hypothetical protein